MFSIFGFGLFGFIFPLIFFGILVRVGVNLFRGLSGRADRTLERDMRFGDPLHRHLADAYDPSARRVGGRGSSWEARIFKLAYRLKGRITLSDVIVDTGLSIEDAERTVEAMVDNVHVRMEVDADGNVTYEFPEIIRRFES